MTQIFECSENGGFHPEVPGHSGAIRALLDDNGNVLEVVPYGSLLSVEKTVEPVQQQEDVQPAEEVAPALPVEEIQPVEPVEPIQVQPVEQQPVEQQQAGG